MTTNKNTDILKTIGEHRKNNCAVSVFRDTRRYNHFIILPRGREDEFVIRAAKHGTALDVLNILREEREDAQDKADRWSLNPRVEQDEIDYFKDRAEVYGRLLDDVRNYVKDEFRIGESK